MIRIARNSLLLAGLALLSQVAHAQPPIAPKIQAPPLATRVALDRMLYEYDVVELPLATLGRQVKNGRLALVLQNRLYQLELTKNDLRAEDYRAFLIVGGVAVEQAPRPVVTYAGHVAGDPESVVRLTATRELFTGYIKTAGEWLFIDPLSDHVRGAARNLAVVYREKDVRPEAGGSCGVEHLRQAGRDLGIGLNSAKNHTTLRRLDIATEGDGEYYQRYGAGGLDRITATLNGVDGIFRSQINLFLRITFQQIWTDPATDPYTSTDSLAVLQTFKDWWNANRAGVNRDTAHLFSGKDLAGSIIGRAYLSVICNNPSSAYGISQDWDPLAVRVELTAHELGHNLSATHDDQSPVCPGVSCNGFGPIMCSIIQNNGSNTFSSCSKTQIDTHTHNNGSCLN